MNSIKTAYTDERQDKYFAVEDSGWWYKYRIRIFADLANAYFDNKKEIVDIGGSNGFNAKYMQEEGFDVLLLEPTKKACENAIARGVKRVQNSSFDGYDRSLYNAMLFDVLEHIENDEAFLNDLSLKMEKDGVLLLSVPAFSSLWSSEDDIDGHFRRYTIASLRKVVQKTEFEIEYYSYFYSFLYLPIFIFRHLKEKLPFVHNAYERSADEDNAVLQKEFVKTPKIVKYTLDVLASWERKRIQKRKKIFFGSSIVCVLRKKKN